MRISAAIVSSLSLAALALAGCSDSNDDPEPTSDSATATASSSATTSSAAASAPSSTDAAPIATNVAGLIVTEADFPAGGTFLAADDAALDIEDAEPDLSTSTPAECKAALNSTEDVTDDRAQATSTFENRELEVEVGATTDTFADDYARVETALANCTQFQMNDQLEDGTPFVVDMTLALSQRTLGGVPVGELATEGTTILNGTEIKIPIHILVTNYEGVSIEVSLNKSDGLWEPSDTLELEAMMQKQIDKIDAA